MGVFKPGPLATSQRNVIENSFRRALMRVVHDIREIIKNLRTPEAITAAITNYQQSDAFKTLAYRSAARMVTATDVGQKKTWRLAANESTVSREIYEALRDETRNTAVGQQIEDLVFQNARLISTVPQNVARQFADFAYRQYSKGVRPEQIAEAMQKKAPQLTSFQVRRIARTESAKAASALMEARCESMQIDFYVWYTCHDSRVRHSHDKMDGILCRWDDPPDPELLFPSKQCRDSGTHYHPGGIYNCRCIALPVIDLKTLSFPIRYAHGNKVETIRNLAQLRQIAA